MNEQEVDFYPQFSLQISIGLSVGVPTVHPDPSALSYAMGISIVFQHDIEAHSCLEVGVEDQEGDISCRNGNVGAEGKTLTGAQCIQVPHIVQGLQVEPQDIRDFLR